MLRADQHRYALVIGAEKMTALCDMQNRDHCVLFGDGAGALLLEAVEPADNPEGYGIRDFYLLSDGSRAEILHQPAGGSNLPPTHETVDQRLHYIHMDGQAVFKGAVRHMYESVMKVLGKVDVAPADVDWFIAHQANERIIISTQQRLKVPLERVYINVGKYGNTTAATIPICLDELREDGKLAPGQNIVLFTFGTGFTWGSSFLVWGGSA
jgi:3-oxoacyl-[acyl-carrier-protein] synthase-3